MVLAGLLQRSAAHLGGRVHVHELEVVRVALRGALGLQRAGVERNEAVLCPLLLKHLDVGAQKRVGRHVWRWTRQIEQAQEQDEVREEAHEAGVLSVKAGASVTAATSSLDGRTVAPSNAACRPDEIRGERAGR